MPGMIRDLRASARRTARAAAFSATGLAFALVALGLLTAALWLLVAQEGGALVAFGVTGAVHAVLAITCLMIGAAQRGPAHGGHDPQPPKEPFVQLAEGFALGMQAGRAARDRKD